MQTRERERERDIYIYIYMHAGQPDAGPHLTPHRESVRGPFF